MKIKNQNWNNNNNNNKDDFCVFVYGVISVARLSP